MKVPTVFDPTNKKTRFKTLSTSFNTPPFLLFPTFHHSTHRYLHGPSSVLSVYLSMYLLSIIVPTHLSICLSINISMYLLSMVTKGISRVLLKFYLSIYLYIYVLTFHHSIHKYPQGPSPCSSSHQLS